MLPAQETEVRAILEAGQDMTVATLMPDGAPHAVVVSYASEGLAIYFGCAPDSQKARNLARDPRVAATVTLPYRDWGEIRGLSIAGRAARLVTAKPSEQTTTAAHSRKSRASLRRTRAAARSPSPASAQSSVMS